MLEAALDLIDRNINPVPVAQPSENSRGKNPIAGEGWQGLIITTETAPKYFANGKVNLGGMMGAHSNGLTDVDCDCPEALEAAPYLLPPTNMLFGRPSTPGAHWLYITKLFRTIDKAAIACDDPVAKKERRQCRIVELRIGGGGKGAQTVFPPSKHESGEIITWEKNGDPAVFDGASLERRVAALAACSLIARYWPGEGVRQDAALALGGFLSRVGKQPQVIKLMVEAIAKAAKDEEWKQRAEAALASDKNLRNGDKKVFGLPKLGELIGIEIANTAAEWLGYRYHEEPASTAKAAPGEWARTEASSKWIVAGTQDRSVDASRKASALAGRYLRSNASSLGLCCGISNGRLRLRHRLQSWRTPETAG
jgi:Bifunctional DNA primase/polymerase, N-terminal